MRILASLAIALTLAACSEQSARQALGTLERDRIVLKATANEIIVEQPVPEGTAVAAGTLLVHLGMSGSLRVVGPEQSPGKHDHIDIQLHNGACLRYNDPRRFGCFLWLEPAEQHPLLRELGPEPLSAEFDGELLHGRSRGRRVPVKSFIMNGQVVVGVGNIYANEALFLAGIDPRRMAGRISAARYRVLADRIKQVLTSAIEQGGTTLRDFVGGDGKPGYFAQQLYVYGRGGRPCKRCGATLRESRLGQRTTVFCVTCQR